MARTERERFIQKIQTRAALDAARSVLRETDRGIVAPAYTEAALAQMADQRSYGESDIYRATFKQWFVAGWLARFCALTAKPEEA